MKLIKIITPTCIAFLLTSLLYNNFNFFILNIGAMWLNVKYYQVIIFGILLTSSIIYIKSREIIKFYKILFLFLSLITLISAVDTIKNLKNYSFLCFLVILLVLIIFHDFIGWKLKNWDLKTPKSPQTIFPAKDE